MDTERINIPETKNQLPDIPKSKEIYSGDSNDAAFEKFVREQITGVSMGEQEEDPLDNEQQALLEADEEYDKFN